jgi:phosphatidate cytidylyltransferase
MSDAESPIPASDLPTRFVMGVVLVAVAVLAVYVGGWPFRLLVLAGAAVMLLEWADMHRVARIWGWLGAILLGLLLLPGIEYFYPLGDIDVIESPVGDLVPGLTPESFADAVPGLLIAGGLGLLLGLVSRRLTMAGGFVYIAIPAFALLVLSWARFDLVLWVLIVTWATDIFAYFAGRGIGGPKLAPRISPSKTWAGLAGGVAGAAAMGWLTAWYFELGSPFLEIGALMGILAQAGDLFESWLKRRAGVKDSGTILPGHGGALDRLDGLLPVVIATFLILASGVWTG